MDGKNSAPNGGFMDLQRIAGVLGITQGMRIADFGSGAGFFAVILAQLAGENGVVTAVDIMESDLESVKAKAKAAGLNNIQTVRSNLEILGSSGLGDNSQDVGVLINILYQSQKKADILRETYRVLKPNGKLLVIDWKKGVGGGAPEELRIHPEEMRDIVEELNFQLEEEVNAGTFHYGFIFRKIT